MYDHMLDHLHGQEWFFSQDFDFFAWKYVVFMRKSSVFTWFFRSKRIKALCFSLFLRDFLSGKKSWDKIDSGSVDEAFSRDFCCGNTWFWNEKQWFFSSFLNPCVYRERDFLFFFYTFFSIVFIFVIFAFFFDIRPLLKHIFLCFWEFLKTCFFSIFYTCTHTKAIPR